MMTSGLKPRYSPPWREKRGEVEPEDLSGNLIVQLGVVTEPLNRDWFERNTGRPAQRSGAGSVAL